MHPAPLLKLSLHHLTLLQSSDFVVVVCVQYLTFSQPLLVLIVVVESGATAELFDSRAW